MMVSEPARLLFAVLERIGRFIGEAEAGLLVAQDTHEDFGETDEHHGEAERHDHADVPLLDADMAQVFRADVGNEQRLDPLEAGHGQQTGVTQAEQAGDNADDALDVSRRQLHQCIDTDVAGGAHAIGEAGEDQPGEQRLGQRGAPGHGLGQADDEITDGEPEVGASLEPVAQVVEKCVEVVEDHVDEGHQCHGGQQKGDETFLEVVPDAPEGVHG